MSYDSIGHQQQEPAEGSRHLILGPIVPEGETWMLSLIAAKNNMDPNEYPSPRVTAELSTCVYLPPRPSDHEVPPPGKWVLLAGDVDVPQFKPVSWEGGMILRSGSQLGAWFRGGDAGDIVELDAIYDVWIVETEAEDGTVMEIDLDTMTVTETGTEMGAVTNTGAEIEMVAETGTEMVGKVTKGAMIT